MNLFALNAFLILSVAAADTPRPQAHLISAGDVGAPALTEAGWCEKCDPDWDSVDCKKEKKDKKESCDNSICSKCEGDWDDDDYCEEKKEDHKEDCEKSTSTSSSKSKKKSTKTSSDGADLDTDFQLTADADDARTGVRRRSAKFAGRHRCNEYCRDPYPCPDNCSCDCREHSAKTVTNGKCTFEFYNQNAPACCAQWGFENRGPGKSSWPFYRNDNQCRGGWAFQNDQEILDTSSACDGKGVCLSDGYYRKVLPGSLPLQAKTKGLRGGSLFLE